MLRAKREGPYIIQSSQPHCSSALPTPSMLYKRLSHFPKVMCPVSGKYGDRSKTELFLILDSKNTNFMNFQALFKLV